MAREAGRHLFGGDVDAYERGRPGHPPRVYELLVQRCGLRPGAGADENPVPRLADGIEAPMQAMGAVYVGAARLADDREPVLDNVRLGKYGRNRTNVWGWPGAASLRKELELHPTPKPVGLLAEAIRDV